MRPSCIEVDLSILTHNLKLIREHIDNRPVMAVVKSNAYGHGLVRVAHLYEQLGVNSLGVALLEEGIILRKSGISLPIAVFGGVLMEQIPELLEFDLEFLSLLLKCLMIQKIYVKPKIGMQQFISK